MHDLEDVELALCALEEGRTQAEAGARDGYESRGMHRVSCPAPQSLRFGNRLSTH